MTRDDLLEELRAVAQEAKHESAESHRTAMNSYGAGYDAGFFAGIERATGLLLDCEAVTQ
jgi:hypothetical protein